MTTISDILTAVQIGETADWEFKSARGGFPGSFWETYSAMANSEGGVVVLGVSDKHGIIHVDGLTAGQVATYQKTLWDGLNNRGMVSDNLLEIAAVGVVPLQSSTLLAIRIPRATRAQRPVYLGGRPFGNTYRRRHEGDYCCDDAEIRRMFADAEPGGRDQRVLKGFTLDDLEASSLAQYRQRLRAARGEHAWLALDDQHLLQRLGGWRHDRATGDEGLTLAGLLMFGRDRAIRDAEAAPDYFVDYREELDPDIRWSDRIYPDGTWEANLLQFYGRVWPHLAAGLPTPFRLENGVRRDETPAHEALREAFVNALIHGDYSAPGGLVIERRPHEIVIENAGTLLVGLEQYRRGGVSECRNVGLQQMFLMIGGGEHAGSGADKIRTGWHSRHWRAPLLETFSHPDRVRLALATVSLIPDDTLMSLKERFGPKVDTFSSSELQALATAEIEGAVSNARLQELTSDHRVDITHMLTSLCDSGLLVSDNRRRWTTYELPTRGAVQLLLAAEDEAQPSGDSGQLDTDSGQLDTDSGQLDTDSGQLNHDVVSQLRQVARPLAGRRKIERGAMIAAICGLCDGRFLTTAQLADLLGRNPEGLRKRFLTPMVREGLLELRYPKATNRPDQAYTAVTRDTAPVRP